MKKISIILAVSFLLALPLSSTGWAQQLTQINLLSPADGAVVDQTPTFMWTVDGGTDNRYVVDILVPPLYFWFRMQITDVESWTLPQFIFDLAPSGIGLYWRVRGADLNQTPLTIIQSDETWWVEKQ